MADSSPEIMTIQETSIYLRIPLSSLYKLAQEGKIPGHKVGRHWRFRRETLNRWLDENLVTEMSQNIAGAENA
jgi:excisionase family DNA binding protein